MKVRGWLIIGPAQAGSRLPPHMSSGLHLTGVCPDASEYDPGVWIIWTPSPHTGAICLVCVDVPLP